MAQTRPSVRLARTEERASGRTASPLRAVSGIDLVAAERAAAELLAALGQPQRGAHMAETPRRLAHAYAELMTAPEVDLTTFRSTTVTSALLGVLHDDTSSRAEFLAMTRKPHEA